MPADHEKNTELKPKDALQFRFTHSGIDDYLAVRMVNFSRGGICFKSGVKINPGERIVVREKTRPIDLPHIQAGREHSAKVKWCRLVAKEVTRPYRIGIAFVNPLQKEHFEKWRAGVWKGY